MLRRPINEVEVSAALEEAGKGNHQRKRGIVGLFRVEFGRVDFVQLAESRGHDYANPPN